MHSQMVRVQSGKVPGVGSTVMVLFSSTVASRLWYDTLRSMMVAKLTEPLPPATAKEVPSWNQEMPKTWTGSVQDRSRASKGVFHVSLDTAAGGGRSGYDVGRRLGY